MDFPALLRGFSLPLPWSWRVLALLSHNFAEGSCAFPSVFPGSSQVYPVGDAREEQRERNSSPTYNPRAFLRLPPSASAFLQPHRTFPAPFLEFLSFPPAPRGFSCPFSQGRSSRRGWKSRVVLPAVSLSGTLSLRGSAQRPRPSPRGGVAAHGGWPRG